ncbi:MAG: hypothetical protein DRN53_06920 [Thermoprotei archaeon]|nr:MAG: hypothetical protein DRN53_06920 [Thermoprotei archaeon]
MDVKMSIEHFMLRELREGPIAVKSTLEKIDELTKTLVDEIEEREIEKGFIIGSGTSFHASLILNYLLSRYTSLQFTAVPASEFELWALSIKEKHAVIAFSQSGESSDIIKAINKARESGVFVVGITNTPGSTLTKLANISIVTRAGEEKAVAATKTHDVQIATSYLLAFRLVKRIDLIRELYKIPEKMDRVLDEEENIKRLAGEYRRAEHIFILGRGVNYPVSLEAALKLKETSMVHAEGFALREFLHGPIQLVNETTPILLILPSEETLTVSKKVVDRLREYKAPLISIVSEHLNIDFTDNIIRIPSVFEDLSALLTVKAAQLFSYFTSILRGYNPDKPTKLAKVVR